MEESSAKNVLHILFRLYIIQLVFTDRGMVYYMEKNDLDDLLSRGIKIDLEKTAPGISYNYDIFDDKGTLVLEKGNTLSKELISTIKIKGIRFLYYASSFKESKNPAGLDLSKNSVSEETVRAAQEASKKLLEHLSQSFEVSDDVAIPAEHLAESTRIIEDIVAQVNESNDSVLNTLKELKNTDEYTFIHSASVGIIGAALGTRLRLPKDTAVTMGIGGMFHDIGKSAIGNSIIHKIEALTNEEVNRIKEHPHIGYSIVDHTEYIPQMAKQIVLLHHERPDGKGYPFGFSEDHYRESVPREVRLMGICDVFSALTTKRSYKDEFNPKRSLRMMQNSVQAPYKRACQFLHEDFRDFIKGIGFMINEGDFIFNEGDSVRLNTGELARIVTLNKTEPLRPIINILSDRAMKPLNREIAIDMTKDPAIYIANILDKNALDEHRL